MLSFLSLFSPRRPGVDAMRWWVTVVLTLASAALHGQDQAKGTPLMQSPRLAPCIEMVRGGADLEARVAACERQLGAKGLVAEERAVLHGLLGTQYFERALLEFDAERGRQDLRLGVTHAARPLLTRSVEHYSEALRLKPDWPMAYANHWNRGFSRELLGQKDAALADYSRTIALKPDFARGWAYRARLLANLGRVDAARADLERAARLAPYDPAVIELRKMLPAASAPGG